MLRKVVSLTLAWMFAVSAISGIMLYIAPPGRIAYWADWSLIGLDKGAWDHLHTVTTLLMIIAVALHLYYNWKPFVSYMKDKATKALAATKELLISLAVVIVIGVGSVMQLPPFNLIIDFGDYVSEEWEVTYGSPPYNHAELDALPKFAERIKLDYTKAKARLDAAGITYDDTTPLLDVATANATSPQRIYQVMTSSAEQPKLSPTEGSGMGRKTLEQFCTLRGINLDKTLEKLKANGIDADPSEKFKDIAERHGINPVDLLEMIEQ
jgi:hypothetical protein